MLERDLQAIGHEGDKNMRLNAGIESVINRAVLIARPLATTGVIVKSRRDTQKQAFIDSDPF